jgi:hypothetical protein
MLAFGTSSFTSMCGGGGGGGGGGGVVDAHFM